MHEFNLMHGWTHVVESIAVVGIVVASFGVMLGIVKPANTLKHVGTILGIVLLLLTLPTIVVSAWSAMSVWQKIGLAAPGIVACLWRHSRRKVRKHND